jgi:hypothetical protein
MPTSSPNTTSVQPRRPDDFTAISETVRPTKVDESAAALERLLQREADHRREERFAWIFVVTMLVDVIAFERLGTSSIFLFLLEVIFLGFMGKWLGVEVVVLPLERLFDRAMRWFPGSNDKAD